jgi:adenylosuccinate synthase
MHAQAIIGAGFGDEGKGYWTDVHAALAQSQGRDPWVVRFNSGAQAGHTVQMPDGRRHVFHHVGSGAFVGAGTFLGAGVALHPMLLAQELDALTQLGVPWPRLVADFRSPVTLPFDVMINQAAEAARGTARHGSCGVGFGETVERTLFPEFALRAGDLWSETLIRDCLRRVQNDHVPARLARLGLPLNAIDAWRWNENILDRFVRDAQFMRDRLGLREPSFLNACSAVIFEGAQGLRLDQDLGIFPYLTRSTTGVPAMLAIAQEAGLKSVHVTYGTRAYLTRHGAGPLPDEQSICPAPGFSDVTNVPNAHQGRLRFASLDPAALDDFITRDLARAAPYAVRVTHDLSVNCLDQMGPFTPLRGGESVLTAHLPDYLAERLGMPRVHQAWGPTRDQAILSFGC